MDRSNTRVVHLNYRELFLICLDDGLTVSRRSRGTMFLCVTDLRNNKIQIHHQRELKGVKLVLAIRTIFEGSSIQHISQSGQESPLSGEVIWTRFMNQFESTVYCRIQNSAVALKLRLRVIRIERPDIVLQSVQCCIQFSPSEWIWWTTRRLSLFGEA